MRAPLWVLVGVLAVCAATPARAADAPVPAWRLRLSDLTAFRYNPLGLETRVRFGLEHRLYESTSPAWKTNFVFLGLYPKLNPASAELAVGAEIQPASFFQLKTTAEVVQYYGTFNIVESFASPTANYSDHAIKTIGDAGGSYSTHAFHYAIEPLLQLKVGPIAVREQLHLDYWDFAQRPGDTVVYESGLDTLVPNGGWTISNDAALLYVSDFGLVLGIQHSLVSPRYRRGDFADPALTAADNAAAAATFGSQNAQQRLGLVGVYTFYDRPGAAFNKPTVVLMVGWYLEHRFRAGAPDALAQGMSADDYTSRAVPFGVIAFAFESDLLSW